MPAYALSATVGAAAATDNENHLGMDMVDASVHMDTVEAGTSRRRPPMSGKLCSSSTMRDKKYGEHVKDKPPRVPVDGKVGSRYN